MAQHGRTPYSTHFAGDSQRAKSGISSKKNVHAVNRAGEVWPEKDSIDCDVHFGLDAQYLGYLYGAASSRR